MSLPLVHTDGNFGVIKIFVTYFQEKRFPVLMLSLLYRCWAQSFEDRPSAAEINGLTSLAEFPRLLDLVGECVQVKRTCY